MGERWKATDALVAVGTDVVVAWQRSQRLVEQADEQMAVGVDAVPPPVAATSLRQMVLPHSAAEYRTARAVLLSHVAHNRTPCGSHSASVTALAIVPCCCRAYPRLSFGHIQRQRSTTPC